MHLLRLLTRLSPQLHENINQRVTRNGKDDTDSRIPPSIVVVVQVDRVQVIASPSVLADSAVSSRLRVDEIRATAWSSHPCLEVFAAGLASWRIEHCELRLGAFDLPVEIREDEQRSHKVVEGVQPIYLAMLVLLPWKV